MQSTRALPQALRASTLVLVAALGLLAAAAPSVALGQRTEQRSLELKVGELVTLSSAGVSTYSVGNEAVIDVKPLNGRMVIVGKQAGESSLLLIYGQDRQVNYAVTVLQPAKGNTSAASLAVPERVNIRLDLYYVEINRSSQLQVGIKWPSALGGQLNMIRGQVPLEPSGAATFDMSLQQILPTIDMLHATGWGRVLRHGTVVTTNGTQAEFDSGGEVYIASVAPTGQASFQTLTFGSRLSVTPNYDKDTGRVEVKVEGEFGDLFDTGADYPGKNRTTSRSTANLALGQAFAIGGVEAKSSTRSKRGLPGLGQIPILGVLFGSHGSEDLEKENIIIVVPTVVDTVPGRTAGILDEVLTSYASFSGDIEDAELARTQRWRA
ncbi:MAG: pilus assembly protein N-terminal domain-containing protein [Polyangiales bacterium]